MTRYLPCLLAVLAGLGLLATLWLAFAVAPVEAEMGVVQKIFYFHVPAAYTMYLAWGVCAAASVAYLVRRRESFDALARSAGEIAALFAVMVMITGPLWGRKAWGAYWTWDPRLTSALLLTLIIFAYVALRSLGAREAERRFAAALSIVGACLVPIIHFSVSTWRGQHPTVIGRGGGGLTAEMGAALAAGLISFTLLFLALLLRRHRLEAGLRRLAELEERAVAAGLLGEDRP
jgi:heme exporter protein C